MSIEFGLLTINNLGCIQEAQVDLGSKGIILIVGENNDSGAANSNGSGKSTIFRALTWLLYGQAVEGGKFDFMMRGSGQAHVSLKLKVDERETLIQRIQKAGGTPSLKIHQEGKRISPRGLKESQELINKMIGLDWMAFRNTVLYGQGDIQHFADPRTTDSQRKAILSKILGFERFDSARKVARLRLRTAQENETDLETKMDRLDGLIEGLQLDWWESQESEWAETNQTKIKEAQEEVSQLRDQMSELDGLQEKLIAFQTRLSRVDGVLDDLQETKAQRADLARQRANIEKFEVSANAFEDVTNVKINQFQAEIERFEDGNCPTCGTPATGSHVKTTVNSSKEQLKKVEGDLEKIQERKKALEDDKKNINSSILEVEEELSEEPHWLEMRGLVDSKIEETEESLGTQSNLEVDIQSLDEEIAQLKVKDNPFTEKIQEARDKAQKYSDELKKLRRGTRVITAQTKLWKFWVDGFGPGGLPSYLLDSVVPVISERTNQYLEILADGDISIRMDTTSELKSGAVKDQLTIHSTIEEMRDVAPSGGQNRKITLACDLALMDIVSQREGSGIDLLLMDEVLDGLDATGRARIMDLLDHLRTQRGTIFLVTHDPELLEFSEKFDHTLKVVKEDGLATVDKL